MEEHDILDGLCLLDNPQYEEIQSRIDYMARCGHFFSQIKIQMNAEFGTKYTVEDIKAIRTIQQRRVKKRESRLYSRPLV